MNLLLFPTIIAAVFALVELSLPEHERLKRDLSQLLFFIIIFIVCIKYYYGPDIHVYVPVYEQIGSPADTLKRGKILFPDLEIGYLLFCSVLKWIGLSYWLFTVAIAFLYFYAIKKVFARLTGYRSLALFALVVFENSLMFFEFRQSIAVSLFLIGIVAFLDRKYLRYALMMILALFVHKSSLFVVLIAFVSLIMPTIKYSRYYYLLLVVLIVSSVFFAIGELLISLADYLPVAERTIFSIKHHLEIEKGIQIILVFYLMLFIALFHYATLPNRSKSKYFILILAFFFFIAVFYRHWFFLNRLRSFFMPLLIVFTVNTLTQRRTRFVFLRQALCVALFVMALALSRGVYLSNKLGESKVLDATTIFDRINRSEKEIRNVNIEKSKQYFRHEYLINQLNKKKL